MVNVERIKCRVLVGGHNVPEEKVIARYDRALALILEVIKSSGFSTGTVMMFCHGPFIKFNWGYSFVVMEGYIFTIIGIIMISKVKRFIRNGSPKR